MDIPSTPPEGSGEAGNEIPEVMRGTRPNLPLDLVPTGGSNMQVSGAAILALDYLQLKLEEDLSWTETITRSTVIEFAVHVALGGSKQDFVPRSRGAGRPSRYGSSGDLRPGKIEEQMFRRKELAERAKEKLDRWEALAGATGGIPAKLLDRFVRGRTLAKIERGDLPHYVKLALELDNLEVMDKRQQEEFDHLLGVMTRKERATFDRLSRKRRENVEHERQKLDSTPESS